MPAPTVVQTPEPTPVTTPAHRAELRCLPGPATVSRVELPCRLPLSPWFHPSQPPATIIFITTIIILFPPRPPHPARPPPGSRLPLRGAVLRVPLGLQPAAAPKPALARLCWTGCRPVIPGISMICSSFILPTLPSSDPASHRFAACRLYANSLLLCSKPVWVTSRWNRCASKFWAI